MVQAIEELFVPVVVYNNHPGEDARLLQRFKEPAWNYQVIRFLDEEGEDIIPRKDRIWNIPDLAERMVTVLETRKNDVPPYLEELANR